MLIFKGQVPFSINTAFLLFVYMTLLGEGERLLVTAVAGIQKLFYFRLFKVGWGCFMAIYSLDY